MRMEAVEIKVSNNQIAAGEPSNLSNPLFESMATRSVPPSRFDPMSAFSSRKRKNNYSQIHQGYFSSLIGNCSPMGLMSPSHSAGLPTPNQYLLNYSIGVSGAWNQSGSSSGRGRSRFHNHDYGCGGSSPRTNLGRGSYHQNNSMPSCGSGLSEGIGRGGFHGCVSAHEQPPKLFYRKFMIEDPWRFLKPVVRQTRKDDMKTPDTLNSWLPESLRMKKAKISEVTAIFSSHSSLAECLSFAFEEAVEGGANL